MGQDRKYIASHEPYAFYFITMPENVFLKKLRKLA